jgi:acetyl-CoA carboxylase carboxyl transferase subunit beta
MIDMIVHRHQLKDTLARVLRLMTKRPPAGLNGKSGNGYDRGQSALTPHP